MVRVVKTRRNFTQYQRQELLNFYRRRRYPSTEEKTYLAFSLGLTFEQVVQWFQNARRRVRSEDIQEVDDQHPQIEELDSDDGGDNLDHELHEQDQHPESDEIDSDDDQSVDNESDEQYQHPESVEIDSDDYQSVNNESDEQYQHPESVEIDSDDDQSVDNESDEQSQVDELDFESDESMDYQPNEQGLCPPPASPYQAWCQYLGIEEPVAEDVDMESNIDKTDTENADGTGVIQPPCRAYCSSPKTSKEVSFRPPIFSPVNRDTAKPPVLSPRKPSSLPSPHPPRQPFSRSLLWECLLLEAEKDYQKYIGTERELGEKN